VKKQIIPTVVIAITVSLILSGIVNMASAQTPQEKFGIAVRKYLEGNFVGSVNDLEKVLKIEPYNEKARNLLVKSCLKLAQEPYEKKDYSRALPWLEKALRYDPKNKEVKNMIAAARQPVKKQKSKQPVRKKTTTAAPAKVARTKKAPVPTGITLTDQQLAELISVTAVPQAQARNGTLMLFGIVIPLVAAGLIIWFLWRFGSSVVHATALARNAMTEEAKRQSEKFSSIAEQQKQLLKVIEQQEEYHKQEKHLQEQFAKLVELWGEQAKTPQETTKLTVKGPDGENRTITDISPQIRARAKSVELIDSLFTDSDIVRGLLAPFLEDKNNRIRANAAVVMYKHNPEIAMNTLREMAVSEDKWMRLSAAWGLGEIGTQDGVKLLEMLLDDSDEDVKQRARTSLEKIVTK
jgi:tetratricopeptide (TPR) repeat protein